MADILISVITQRDVEVKDLKYYKTNVFKRNDEFKDQKPFKTRDFKRVYSGKSVIHYACQPKYNVTNRLEVIKYLVEVRKVSVNVITDDGYYPLQILFWGIDQKPMVKVKKKTIDELKKIVHVFKKVGADFHVERNGVTPFMLCSKYFKEIRLLKRIGFPSMNDHPLKLVKPKPNPEEKLVESKKEYPEKKLLRYTNPITYFYVYSKLRGVRVKTQESLKRVIKKIKDLERKKGAVFEKDIEELEKEKDVMEEKIDVKKRLVKVKERIDELKNMKSNEKVRRIDMEIKRLEKEEKIIERRIKIQSQLKQIRPDGFTGQVFWGVPSEEGEQPYRYIRKYEVMEFGNNPMLKSKLDEKEPKVSYRDYRKQQLKENPNAEIVENKTSIWTGFLKEKNEILNTVYFMFMFIEDIKDLDYFWNDFFGSFKHIPKQIQKVVMDDNKEEFRTSCLHLLFLKRFMNSDPEALKVIDQITKVVKCRGDLYKNFNGVTPGMLYVQNYKPIEKKVDEYEKIIIEKKKVIPDEKITSKEDTVIEEVIEISEEYVKVVHDALIEIPDINKLEDSQKNTLLHYVGFGRNLLMHFILQKAFPGKLKPRKNEVFGVEYEEEGKINFEPYYNLVIE